MKVTYWLNGEEIVSRDEAAEALGLLHVGDRWCTSHRNLVIAERWIMPDGVHFVLRHPETPSECTPPWERGKDK